MRNKITSSIIILTGAALFWSCNRDFLNTQPMGQISANTAWTDGALAEAFVTDIYNGLQQGGIPEQELASLSDEAVFVHPGRGINTVNEGTLSPSNQGWVDATYEWNNMYNRIRPTNVASTHP